MKLEVGEFYLSAGGEVVQIEQYKDGLFLDSAFSTYYENGSYTLNKQSKYDLIAHIPKELHYALIQGINEYYINKDFKINVDENFNNFSNKK